MKTNQKTYLSVLFLFILTSFFFLSPLKANDSSYDEGLKILETIPILNQGRAKPLDTFARESLRKITGGLKFEGKSALENILSWMLNPNQSYDQPVIVSKHKVLNEKLGIQVNAKSYVSAKSLMDNEAFKSYLKEINVIEQAGDKPNALQKEAIALLERLELFHQIANGSFFKIIPIQNSNDWLTPVDVQSEEHLVKIRAVFQDVSSQSPHLSESAFALKNHLRALSQNVSSYPSEKQIQREILFNQIRPFQLAWILFFVSFVFFSLKQLYGAKIFSSLGMMSTLVAMLLSTYGLVVRSLIAGRPPVSNMYETVLWVAYGTVLFALIFERIYRFNFLLIASTLFSALNLLLADLLPNVLSPSIQPLVPVLRSNYWLTIHVLTITLSYAAFALSMGLSQITLYFYAFKFSQKETIQKLNLLNYRSVQVGVVLVAAGTILGGVWAADSWGRFWGWDPKEVWALITLLGYLAILHGRFAGWLKGFRFALWSVLAFLLVLMAWYGVNFILGVGLHSYGFSSGGFKGMLTFVTLQFLWLGFVLWKVKANAKSSS